MPKVNRRSYLAGSVSWRIVSFEGGEPLIALLRRGRVVATKPVTWGQLALLRGLDKESSLDSKFEAGITKHYGNPGDSPQGPVERANKGSRQKEDGYVKSWLKSPSQRGKEKRK